MTFTYTNPAGINKQVELDIDALIETRWNNNSPRRPSWTQIAKASGISGTRMTDIRKSPEWKFAVAEFLSTRGIRLRKEELRWFDVTVLEMMRMNAPSGISLRITNQGECNWVTA